MDTESPTREQDAVAEEMSLKYDAVEVRPLWSGHVAIFGRNGEFGQIPLELAQRIVGRDGEDGTDAYKGATLMRGMALLDAVRAEPATESAHRRLLSFAKEVTSAWMGYDRFDFPRWELAVALRPITGGGALIAEEGEPVLVDPEPVTWQSRRIVSVRAVTTTAVVAGSALRVERTVAPVTEDEAAAEREAARGVDCPVCVSRVGEDCCPVSMTRPHRARLDAARGEG